MEARGGVEVLDFVQVTFAHWLIKTQTRIPTYFFSIPWWILQPKVHFIEVSKGHFSNSYRFFGTFLTDVVFTKFAKIEIRVDSDCAIVTKKLLVNFCRTLKFMAIYTSGNVLFSDTFQLFRDNFRSFFRFISNFKVVWISWRIVLCFFLVGYLLEVVGIGTGGFRLLVFHFLIIEIK